MAALAAEVDGFGDQLLADAAFSLQQHRRIRRRYLVNKAQDLPNGFAFAQDDGIACLPCQHLPQLAVLFFQPQPLKQSLQREKELVRRKGFGQVIGSALFDGFHGAGDRPVARQDDDLHIRMPLQDGVQQLLPAHPGHPQVGDDEGDFVPLEPLQCFRPVLCRHDGITVAPQQIGGHLQDIRVVIYEQYFSLHRHPCLSASVIVGAPPMAGQKARPPTGSFRRATRW